MSSGPVLVDTGILVALLNRKERHHKWTVAKSKELRAPLLTCEPVITETFFLISKIAGGPRRFFELLDTGTLEVDFSILEELPALAKLMQKYMNVPMSLADACLVRMAELHPSASVFTLDADFSIYRKHGRQAIPVLMPES